MAEEEILQARISELTQENTAIEEDKCKLQSKLEEVMADKREGKVVISDELTEEKRLSDHKGISGFGRR